MTSCTIFWEAVESNEEDPKLLIRMTSLEEVVEAVIKEFIEALEE